MKTQSSQLEEYAAYIENRSLRELKVIASYLDQDRHPDRYRLVTERIDAKQAQSGSSATDQDPQHTSCWFRSPAVPREQSIHWSYLLFPIGIIAMVFLIGATLAGWDMLLHRPWMAWPIAILLNTIFVGFLLFYGVRACKKLGYWPLARLQSARYVASRFFESFLILILINISIGLLLLSVRALFDIEATQPVLIRFATYAPNSWGVVGFLVAAFTLGPVIEEMFFRGFLYNALKTKTSMATACMVQAAVFALCHQNGLLGNVAIFLYGAALAVVYEKKGNLLSPCLIHCIGNALIAVPLLIATLGNLHPVAETFTEAADAPHWLASSPPEYVERKATGSDQVEYAIDTWGSRGAKQWKREADAFGAVPVWFPDDRASSARAKLGLVAIYAGYLQDYRRAILAAKELRRLYPDQTEQCASSLSHA